MTVLVGFGVGGGVVVVLFLTWLLGVRFGHSLAVEQLTGHK